LVVILRAGAVEVNCSAIGGVATVKLDMLQAGAVGVYLGSSIVLAAVTIVVEHRARLLVSRIIAGVTARLLVEL
jgi:cell division protein FtsL